MSNSDFNLLKLLKAPMKRRHFLSGLGFTAGLAVASQLPEKALAGWRNFGRYRGRRVSKYRGANPFTLGVASGEPTHRSIVLWTRLAPEPLADDGQGGMPLERFRVRWEIWKGDAKKPINRVKAGREIATPKMAHALHITVKGLEPNTYYWYKFRIGGYESPLGRTRTAPAPGDKVPVKFAYSSCSHYEQGFFNSYKHIAEEADNLYFFAHLGDYIYEYAPAPEEDIGKSVVRVHNDSPGGFGSRRKGEIVTLADYRNRIAQYRTDPYLQEAHRLLPFITIWDDHEIDNNWTALTPEGTAGPVTYSPLDHTNPDDPNFLLKFASRRDNGFKAYYEMMPLGNFSKPTRNNELGLTEVKLFHRLRYGQTADFYILDGRQYRTNQACETTEDFPGQELCEERDNESNTFLGTEQLEWLLDNLKQSQDDGITWKVLVQEVVFAQYNYKGFFSLSQEKPANYDPTQSEGETFNLDQWDGYPVERQKILDHIDDNSIDNVIVISGDWHAFWANDIKKDFNNPNSKTLATEFASSSISAGCTWAEQLAANQPANPHVKYLTGFQRGYVTMEFQQDGDAAITFRSPDTVMEQNSQIRSLAKFKVANGSSGVVVEDIQDLPSTEQFSELVFGR